MKPTNEDFKWFLDYHGKRALAESSGCYDDVEDEIEYDRYERIKEEIKKLLGEEK